MTMKERVEMWKASKYVTENDKKEKRMMPHQLLELYRKPKPVRIVKKVQKKEYTCDICDKTYSCKHCLYRHQSYHQVKSEVVNTEDLYSCDICNKQYAFKGNMIKHKKTHETLPIDQPDIDLDEYMDEEWDVTDIWQSLRRDEAAMEKYLKNKKK